MYCTFYENLLYIFLFYLPVGLSAEFLNYAKLSVFNYDIIFYLNFADEDHEDLEILQMKQMKKLSHKKNVNQ